MKKIVGLFIESPNAHIMLVDLIDSEDSDLVLNERFIFHIGLLLDNDMITNKDFESHNLESIGIYVHTIDHYSCWDKEIRLTQSGHDFANILNQNEIIETLKVNFRDYPFKVMLEAGKELSTAFMKRKLKELTGISE